MVAPETYAIHLDLMLPWGKAILIASFGYCLLGAIRGEENLSIPIERVVLATLFIIFYPTAVKELEGLSKELQDLITHASGEIRVEDLVLESLKTSALTQAGSIDPRTINIPNLIEQALRTGVWGALSLVVRGVFLFAGGLLEIAQAVFWKLLLILFPITCGLYPAFPGLLRNQCFYAVELQLWLPTLALVEVITSDVARRYLVREGSWGLHLVAVEVIAIFLILNVPKLTHRFLSAALNEDHGSSNYLIQMGKNTLNKASSWISKRGFSR